jgi:hypothetical protein
MIHANENQSDRNSIQFGSGRITFLIALAMLALAPLSVVAQQSPTVAGDYSGALGPLHVKLHLKVSATGRIAGTLDSPDRGAIGIHCANLHVDGQSFTFTVPAVQAAWKGTIAADGTLNGTWDQGDSLSLTFVRDTPASPERATNVAGVLPAPSGR